LGLKSKIAVEYVYSDKVVKFPLSIKRNFSALAGAISFSRFNVGEPFGLTFHLTDTYYYSLRLERNYLL
jgi:hypothetical protein